MKKIFYILILSLISFSSCHYHIYDDFNGGVDGADGKSFFRTNWVDQEPEYITTSGLLPENFVWNKYYYVRPGIFTIDYAYRLTHGPRDVIKTYSIELEVFRYLGEDACGSYDGRDGDDVLFDLVLYYDFYDPTFDYYHEVLLKSGDGEDKSVPKIVTEKTFIGQKEEIKGNTRITYKFYENPTIVE